MSIRKEDLHKLVDLVNEQDVKFVYDLIKVVLEKDIIVEADNSPLSEQEMKILEGVSYNIENEELIDWKDIDG